MRFLWWLKRREILLLTIFLPQVHLGFFPTEEYAARSYDRAAINKGAKEHSGKIVTNFSIEHYSEELQVLRRVSQEDLIFALSTER